MAFDQSTRNRLARFVSDARTLLTEEFTRQLQNEYGLDPESGTVTGLEKLTAQDDTKRETARILRETQDYYLAGKTDDKKNRQDVLQRIVREQAFTVLNRLCALRMAESRGILIESIAKGYQSQGFQLYARLAGTGLGETGDAYSSYLFSLFDEFAVDLAVLFDRFNPQGRLFPRQTALVKLLDLINDLEIEQLWSEDETIGWMYQYFNTKEERKEMRDASQAPRNSRELAVRNQFFTPRYVVEFLTDNTLGRIWYEMTKGETALKDSCHYLVRRPTEVFLKDGEAAPVQASADEYLSQEEQLKQTVYIPHRPLKDPREIKMLDPACGSMHFGLYAFDLFEQIYAEAWDLEETLGKDALWHLADLDSLHDTYASKELFLRDVPRLIIERNIHGVDIDPRAVQIAGLSLWLRAQKSWHAQGVKPQDRPQIRRSNIVCAEPMPGDRALLEEFLQTFKEDRLEALMRRVLHVPAGQKVRATKPMADALANLVRTVWQEMELAGEAGSLLQIEVTLRDAIEKASNDSKEKAPLFSVLEFGIENSSQNASSGADGNFWSWAETLVLEALREYAGQSESDSSFRRQLFSDDATQGFAFIDLCRKHYDVILMNPPFGGFSHQSKEYVIENYLDCKEDIDAAFVKRGVHLSNVSGVLGAIINRTQLFKSTLYDWRRSILLGESELNLLADLGHGVLDNALVEAAAYVLENSKDNHSGGQYFKLLQYEDKGANLLNLIQSSRKQDYFDVKKEIFLNLPEARISYWAGGKFLRAFKKYPQLESQRATARQGVATADDFRFVRLAWEISDQNGDTKKPGSNYFPFFAKGGEYAPYFGDIHLTINWKQNAAEIKAFSSGIHPQRALFFRKGATWSVRTSSGFSPRILPEGCAFSHTGDTIFMDNSEDILGLLGMLMSRPTAYIIECMVAAGDAAARSYEVGIIRKLPIPTLSVAQNLYIANSVRLIWNNKREIDSQIETGRYFILPGELKQRLQSTKHSIKDLCLESIYQNEQIDLSILELTWDIEKIARKVFELSPVDISELDNEFGAHPQSFPEDELDHQKFTDLYTGIEETSEEDSYETNISSRKNYFTNRRIENLSILTSCNPKKIVELRAKLSLLSSAELLESVDKIVSYALGCAFGRWDIRYATGELPLPEISSDPFAPFPNCPPGSLRNKQKMFASHKDNISESYTLKISWNGIFVADEGHTLDVGKNVRETLRIIWREHIDHIEQESCQILGIRSLREYFAKPNGFFATHLSQYSKSRRQAPIYWPLSTPSNSYTLWLYYHRLNNQTLFTCVNDFVDPKIKQVSEEAKNLRQKKSRSSAEEKELERLTDFEHELKDFRDELLRVAKFWKPNLNDGVQITAAPLWKLFQHKPWQKKLRETWESLEAGEYDWAHLAYSIWPERIREKCKSDKSLAIAHDLEHLYVEIKKPLKKKAVSKKKSKAETEELFNED